MSDHAQAEFRPLQELDALVRHLVDDLAGYRRRALVAEARLKEIEAHEDGAASVELVTRCTRLEQENEKLQDRLATASTRARQMLERVRFLRQQAQGGDR